jgi:transposase
MHAFAEVAQVPSKNTTRTCNVCGVVHPFDAKHNIWREPVCPECGSTWDQDENAGVNILRVWQERESGPPSGPRPAKAAGRSRFERARLAAVERSQEKARKAAEAAGAEAPDTSDAAED